MNMNQVEREEEALEQQLARGEITTAEYNRGIRELHRSVRDEIRGEAESTYQDVMNRY